MIDWMNVNSGFVSVLIFIVTIFLGWVSGIFGALRRKPKFKIEVLQGPSICSVFYTGNKHQGFDAHRTAISLYLKITNIGNAPSQIDGINAGYHWNLNGINWLWLKYGIGWFWLRNVTIALEDFHVNLGDEKIKYFPFLLQKSILVDTTIDTYLEVGKSAIGMVYFEQQESWGASSPKPDVNGKAVIKVKVHDSFSRSYSTVVKIPLVGIEEAKKYNQYFGETFATINNSGENIHNKQEHTNA